VLLAALYCSTQYFFGKGEGKSTETFIAKLALHIKYAMYLQHKLNNFSLHKIHLLFWHNHVNYAHVFLDFGSIENNADILQNIHTH